VPTLRTNVSMGLDHGGNSRLKRGPLLSGCRSDPAGVVASCAHGLRHSISSRARVAAHSRARRTARDVLHAEPLGYQAGSPIRGRTARTTTCMESMPNRCAIKRSRASALISAPSCAGRLGFLPGRSSALSREPSPTFARLYFTAALIRPLAQQTPTESLKPSAGIMRAPFRALSRVSQQADATIPVPSSQARTATPPSNTGWSMEPDMPGQEAVPPARTLIPRDPMRPLK